MRVTVLWTPGDQLPKRLKPEFGEVLQPRTRKHVEEHRGLMKERSKAKLKPCFFRNVLGAASAPPPLVSRYHSSLRCQLCDKDPTIALHQWQNCTQPNDADCKQNLIIQVRKTNQTSKKIQKTLYILEVESFFRRKSHTKNCRAWCDLIRSPAFSAGRIGHDLANDHNSRVKRCEEMWRLKAINHQTIKH